MKVVLLMMLFSFQAMAGWLLEPYVGINVGAKDNVKTITTGITSNFKDGKVNGDTFIGGRAAYTFFGLFGGLDYRKMMTGEDDTDTSTLGLTVGYEFPILVRGWITYVLTGSAEDGNLEYDSDGGTRLGVGFTGLPFVSLNIEYEKTDFSSDGSGTQFSLAEIERESLILSVSLPLNL